MFKKILHANDGSEPAFQALQLAITIGKQMARGIAARRFHPVLQRARAMAEQQGMTLQTHVLAGHPVRTVVELARELEADLLVIGATGHSALYERMIRSRAIQLASCPVLVVK